MRPVQPDAPVVRLLVLDDDVAVGDAFGLVLVQRGGVFGGLGGDVAADQVGQFGLFEEEWVSRLSMTVNCWSFMAWSP